MSRCKAKRWLPWGGAGLALLLAGPRPAVAHGDETGAERRPYLGVVLGEKDGETRISMVMDDTGAARAGLEPGDVILEVDGKKVGSPDEVVAEIEKRVPDDSLRLRLRRRGKEIETSVVLGSRPGKRPHSFGFELPHKGLHGFVWRGSGQPPVRLGVQVQPLTEGLRRYFQVRGDGGVLVAEVTPDSAASRAGLEPGDVLLAVDGETVGDYGELVSILEGHEPGDRVELRILRRGAEQRLEATLEKRAGTDAGQQLGSWWGPAQDRKLREALERAGEELKRSLERLPKPSELAPLSFGNDV